MGGRKCFQPLKGGAQNVLPCLEKGCKLFPHLAPPPLLIINDQFLTTRELTCSGSRKTEPVYHFIINNLRVYQGTLIGVPNVACRLRIAHVLSHYFLLLRNTHCHVVLFFPSQRFSILRICHVAMTNLGLKSPNFPFFTRTTSNLSQPSGSVSTANEQWQLIIIKQYVVYESMVSFVSRRYMRVVNGSLMVCLAYSNRKTKCQIYRKISRN